jgi:hypothetical protein
MLTILPPSCAVVKKSGNLNFLEPSGPPQACNGTALSFTLYELIKVITCGIVSGGDKAKYLLTSSYFNRKGNSTKFIDGKRFFALCNKITSLDFYQFIIRLFL